MKNDEAESRQVEGQTNNRLSVDRPVPPSSAWSKQSANRNDGAVGKYREMEAFVAIRRLVTGSRRREDDTRGPFCVGVAFWWQVDR